MLVFIHQPAIFEKEKYFKELNSTWHICLATAKSLLDIHHYDHAITIICTYLRVFNPYFCFFVGFFARPIVSCYINACDHTVIAHHFEKLMTQVKLKEICQFPGMTVLIFEFLLKRQFFDEHVDHLVRKAIIYCMLGFRSLNSTSVAWAQRYLIALVPKYFPERKGNNLLVIALINNK